MQIIIDTADTSITVKNKVFLIERGKFSKQISPKRITSIAITTNCTLNTSAIRLAALNQIPIYFFNNFGTMHARISSPYFTNIADLRKKQLQFYNTEQATNWILEILSIKVNTQIETLKRLSKKQTKLKTETKENIEKLKNGIIKSKKYKNIPIESCRKNILGIEGSLSKQYFRAIQCFLPPQMKFSKRTRQPAQDYFNAALNYLYGMTYSIVESGVFAKGLDPFVGYMHTDNYLKTSLVFDLIEPIRPLIDRMLINLCIEEKLNETHFVAKQNGGFWINKAGKRILIPTFNEYLHQRIRTSGRVQKLKDIIYSYSNQLGNQILKSQQ